jgi:hypothetical protein
MRKNHYQKEGLAMSRKAPVLCVLRSLRNVAESAGMPSDDEEETEDAAPIQNGSSDSLEDAAPPAANGSAS